MPRFKRRGLALDEGGFAFFSGLYLLLLQVAWGEKKKKKPQFWPVCKCLKKNGVHTNSTESGLNLWALMSMPVPSMLLPISAPAG